METDYRSCFYYIMYCNNKIVGLDLAKNKSKKKKKKM